MFIKTGEGVETETYVLASPRLLTISSNDFMNGILPYFNILLAVHPDIIIVFFPLLTCVLNSHPKRVTIPDAVLIQFDLLRMSIIVLETCR